MSKEETIVAKEDKEAIDNPEAVVTKMRFLDMQVCVPGYWLDKEVINFANKENPCGNANGWQIRKEGDPLLKGDSERNPCEKTKRKGKGFVHIMLDC